MNTKVAASLSLPFLLAACGDDCSSELLETSASPNATAQASFFRANCGATTAYRYEVRVIKAPAAMDDIVLGLIEGTVEVVKGGGPGGGYGLYQIWDPLLRIYASSSANSDRLKRCLNVIDTLVQLDAVGSSKLNTVT